MAQGFAGAATGTTSAQTAERRDTIQTRLQGACNMLGLCADVVTAIEERIEGPRPDKPSGGTPPSAGLAGLTMEIGNEAERLRDRLVVVLNALG